MLPLYQDTEKSSGDLIKKRNSNIGLVFTKYFNKYDSSLKQLKDSNAKSSFISEDVINNFSVDNNAMKEAIFNTIQLITAKKGVWKVLVNDWNFVTGMGIDHPTENGFLWHHTLGVPYLPGSSIKGMLRGFLSEFSEKSFYDKDKIIYIFGNENEEEREDRLQSGNFVFMDAIPIEKPELTIDIMTPHQKDWYESKSPNIDNPDSLPADYHTPVPVSFLAVKKITFLFGILPRIRSEENISLLSDLITQLEMALDYVGIGSKTGTGYGRFSFDKVKTEKLDKELLEINKTNEISRKEMEEKKQQEREIKSKLDNYPEEIRENMSKFLKDIDEGIEKETDKNKDRLIIIYEVFQKATEMKEYESSIKVIAAFVKDKFTDAKKWGNDVTGNKQQKEKWKKRSEFIEKFLK